MRSKRFRKDKHVGRSVSQTSPETATDERRTFHWNAVTFSAALRSPSRAAGRTKASLSAAESGNGGGTLPITNVAASASSSRFEAPCFSALFLALRSSRSTLLYGSSASRVTCLTRGCLPDEGEVAANVGGSSESGASSSLMTVTLGIVASTTQRI